MIEIIVKGNNKKEGGAYHKSLHVAEILHVLQSMQQAVLFFGH